jgi:hypothetical protein
VLPCVIQGAAKVFSGYAGDSDKQRVSSETDKESGGALERAHREGLAEGLKGERHLHIVLPELKEAGVERYGRWCGRTGPPGREADFPGDGPSWIFVINICD